MSDEPRKNQGRGLVDRKQSKAHSSNFIARRLFRFGSLVICDVLLFTDILVLYINMKIGKNRYKYHTSR